MEQFESRIKPSLRREDDGKYVAIDVDTGEFEMDVDDLTAIRRLKARCPSADVWLGRAGFRATCRIGRSR
jgi:hypothetical protein